MTHIAPLIPETAPFNASQRAWLNGWLAAYYGAAEGAAPCTADAGRRARICTARRPRTIIPGTIWRCRSMSG